MASGFRFTASADNPPIAQQHEIITPLVFQPPIIKPTPVKLVAPRIPIRVPVPAPQPQILVKRLPPIVIPERPKLAVTIAPPAPEPLLQTELKEVPMARLKTPDQVPRVLLRLPAPVKTGLFENTGQSPNGRSPSARLEVQTGGFAGAGGTRGPARAGRPALPETESAQAASETAVVPRGVGQRIRTRRASDRSGIRKWRSAEHGSATRGDGTHGDASRSFVEAEAHLHALEARARKDWREISYRGGVPRERAALKCCAWFAGPITDWMNRPVRRLNRFDFKPGEERWRAGGPYRPGIDYAFELS